MQPISTLAIILAVTAALGNPTRADDTPATTQPAAAAPQPQSTQPPTTQPAATQPAPNDAPLLGGEDLDDIGLLDLDIPTVVTAARHEQQITDVPYAISVITAEQIRRSGARNIPDALRLVPGVDVADLTYGVSAVSPRAFHGFLSRQVLVLVDGRQIFDSLFGGTLWGSWPFQLEDIARIEVIRGPAGVTWGANAVNGVINIITKTPRNQEGVTITASGGSRGSWKTHLGYAFADEKLQLRISSEYEASDGFKRGGSILRQSDDFYRAGRMNLHAILQATEADTITFSTGSAVMAGAFPQTPLALLGGRRPGSQANFVLGRWTHKLETDNTLEITGYINDFTGAPGVQQIDYRYQQYALQLHHTFKPADQHLLTWGVDARIDDLDASLASPFMLSRPDVTAATIGLYLQDEWSFAQQWTLNLGARLDYDSYGSFQPSGRAALAHRFNQDHSAFAAVSYAFQMPPGALRFLDIPLAAGLVRAVSNRGLKEQTLLGYELGYRGRLWNRLDLAAVLFWNEHYDITTLSPGLGGSALITAFEDNRAAASIYGLELDARLRVNKQMLLLGNYTFQQLDWRSRDPIFEKDVLDAPSHKFMLGAEFDLTDDLRLGSHLYFVDNTVSPNPKNPFIGRPVSAYFRWDASVEHDFWNDRAALALGVRNLLDNHHPEGRTIFLNDTEVPRMFYAELRIHFD